MPPWRPPPLSSSCIMSQVTEDCHQWHVLDVDQCGVAPHLGGLARTTPPGELVTGPASGEGRGADADGCGWMAHGRTSEEETMVPHRFPHGCTEILENGLREEEEGCAQIFYEWRALFCKKGSATGPFNCHTLALVAGLHGCTGAPDRTRYFAQEAPDKRCTSAKSTSGRVLWTMWTAPFPHNPVRWALE
jgi:hypothetical protein